MKKIRIDKLLVDRGLVQSRERARALIMAGDVLVDDTPVQKAGAGVGPASHIRLRRPPHPFVGRGGVKLRGALDQFDLDPAGAVCADVGASTGGFTDCLLMAGAKHVYAYDGGHLWPNSVQLRAMKNYVDLPNLLLDPVAG